MRARKQLLYFRIKPPPHQFSIRLPNPSQSSKRFQNPPQPISIQMHSKIPSCVILSVTIKFKIAKSHKAKDYHQQTNITEFFPCMSCLLHISYFHLYSKYVLFIFLYLVLHVLYFHLISKYVLFIFLYLVLHISYFHLFSKYVLFIFPYLVLHVSYFLLGFQICPIYISIFSVAGLIFPFGLPFALHNMSCQGLALDDLFHILQNIPTS